MRIDYNGPWPRQIKIGKNGVVVITKTMQLNGVTPEMLKWFGQNLGVENYLKWHPDHIARKKVEEPGKPPYYLETQRLGKKVYAMKLVKSERFPDGSHATTLKFPLFTYYSRSIAKLAAAGVSQASESWIGSTMPVLGHLWNWYLRVFVLPDFLKILFIHQDEEGANTEKIVPGLYAAAADRRDSR